MRQTKEHVRKTALKYTSRKEFKMNSTAEYSAACRFKKEDSTFMDSICSHMKSTNEVRKKYLKYTKSILLKEAKKYKTRNDFRKTEPQMYKALLKMDKKEKGLMDKACSHMKTYSELRKTPLKEYRKRALECKTKTEFRKKYPSLYKGALEINKTKANFMQSICSHMIDLIEERELNYTKQTLVPELRKMLRKYRLKFKIHQEYVVNQRDRVDLVIEIKGKVTYYIPIEVKHDYSEWSEKQIKEQILKYNRFFNNQKNTTKTYLVSPKGKYGESAKDFINKLESSIKNKHKLEKPNYVKNIKSFKNTKEKVVA